MRMDARARSSGQDAAPELALRERGLRVTRPRVAVVEALREEPHASAASVLERASAAHPTLSSQAVYGILDDFVEAGLARRFAPPEGAARYELRVGDSHHHLSCVDCGRVVDVDCAAGATPCLEPGDAAGFEVLSAELTFLGRCPECRAARPPAP